MPHYTNVYPVQVLTVHSLYRIENHCTLAMEFRMTLMAEQQERRFGRGSGGGHRIPKTGLLAPGEHCYLPVLASLGALVYMKAEGYQRAAKDVIRVQGDLNKQQGLYTCPCR